MTLHKRSILFVRLLMVLALCVASALPTHAYTVVIDAGHGGKDHGAIDNNVREKDINLGVALKVAKLLRKHHKDLKVVLTRDKDEYLTLQQRADIANKAKGDLFISIHTNSVAESNPNRTTVAGASTYTLGLHKDAANMDVARRENSVMTYESNYDTKYAGFDPNSDESYIIFEMAQKSNMAQSVKFANAVQRQMAKVAARKDRGVHQAGFWVLWATSMPAALIELDFICNPNSAKYISSEQGQDKLAEAISNAVADYFKTLAKHEKERLRTEQPAPQPDDALTPADDVVVLAAVETPGKKSSEAPAVIPAERTRRPATRRRRSEAAREKSEQQEYEVAVLPEQVQYVAAVPETITSEPAPAETTPAQPDAEKTSKKKTATKQKKQQKVDKKGRMASHKQSPGTRTVGGKTVYVVSNQPTSASETPATQASAPAAEHDKQEKQQAVAAANSKVTTPAPKGQTKKSTKAATDHSSPVRLARVNTVYKIQIYACDKVLKEKDPLFGGLYPVTCSKTGDNLYTYYYGESQSQGEIYRLLSDVQKVFPEAKVVKARRQ